MLSIFSARNPGEAAVGGGAAGNKSAAVIARVEAATAPNTLFTRLGPIVAATATAPTIVNEASNFVVVTYWWGRGNMNKNVARPCLDFYELLLMKPVNTIVSKIVMTHKDLSKEIDWRVFFLSDRLGLKKFYHLQIAKYLNERGIRGPGQKDHNPVVYEENYQRYLQGVLEIINAAFTDPRIDAALREILKARASAMVAIQEQESILSEIAASNTKEVARIKDLVKEMKSAIDEKVRLATDIIKADLRKYIFGAKAGEPPVPFLEGLLMYRPPIRYEEMIARWEAQCASVGCNYMAVEYPEFAKPGGYQLAINAKPLFIQKALELCAPRAVLYIDGDMFVNMYPHIFDLPDIDYMARGWGVDPRSSHKHEEGDISIDPYVFETSGGIMYFSQTPESHRLLDLWVYYSSLPSEKGKADDRIISMFFNTLELLAPMKIIQLPIEYLWLTLDYERERDRIYVEHPECLTSEDTATSGSSTGGRSPTLYKVLEKYGHKRSEMLYESVLFPTAALADSFRPYFDYLNDEAEYQAQFLDEDSADLAGEKPFYVVPFGSFDKWQPVYDANVAAAKSGPDVCAGEWSFNEAYTNVCVMDRKRFTIPNILQQLSRGRTIIYQPNGDADVSFKVIDAVLKDNTKSRLEFVFFEKRTVVPLPLRLNFQIDLDKAMLIRSNERSNLDAPRLPPLFTMFALMRGVDEIENVFANNYQFLSMIRCHAAILPSAKPVVASVPAKKSWFSIGKATRRQSGGDRPQEEMVEAGTNVALEAMYGPIKMTGGRRRLTTTRRRLGGRGRKTRRGSLRLPTGKN
jgi:hypothetical protein